MSLAAVIPPRAPVRDRWSWVTGDWHYLPNNPLWSLSSRSFTARLLGNSEASFTIDSYLPEAANVTELVSDLWILRNGLVLFRGRVGSSQDSCDGTAHTTQFTAADYRAALARRLLFDSDTLTWTNTDQGQVAWNLVNQTQTKSGGSWGIVRGATRTTGTLVTSTFEAGSTVEEDINQLANNAAAGFDWDVQPSPNASSTQLTFDIWPGQRGTDRAVVLDYPGRIQAFTRQLDPSVFANALRASGGTPTGGGTGPSPIAVTASTIGTDPAGRWDGQFSDTGIVTAAALSAAAQKQLAAGQVVTPAWTVTLAPDTWGGPSDIWVGDPVTLAVQSGRLDVQIPLRVYEIKVDIDDESDAATVQLTLGAVPPSRKWLYRSVESRIRKLERKGP